MNKLCLICACVACLSFFSSCNKSESENHCLWMIHPQNYHELYADQVEDSIVFQTFDSYVAKPYNSDWITITAGASYDVNYNPTNLYTFKTLLALTPNTTGRTRYGYVQLNSYTYSCNPIYVQFGFLNINNPVPTFPGQDADFPDGGGPGPVPPLGGGAHVPLGEAHPQVDPDLGAEEGETDSRRS